MPLIEITTNSKKKVYGKTTNIPNPDKFSGNNTLKYIT
jgi:hypothetical protein